MQIGVHARLTAESIDVSPLARAAEELGFESLFVPEHTHMTSAFVAANPDRADWAAWAGALLDPFVALATAAAVTDRILLGTGVCLVPQHHPITLAKRVATLDRLSAGRFLFGVGAGWVEEEMQDHGVTRSSRFRLLRESLLGMQAIWANEEASFEGELVSFAGVRQGPKPLQQPHPPILVGGEGRRAPAIAREVGGEWFPHAGADLDAGRGLPVTIFGAEPDRDALARYADAGVERCVLILPSSSPHDVGGELERLAHIASLG